MNVICRFDRAAQLSIELVFILLAWGSIADARAASSIDYLQAGTQVGSFQLVYDLDGYTTGVSTLASNLGAIGGMTRLPNGDMAVGIGSRHSTDKRYYIYIFRFDLTKTPPYTIVKGPLVPRYPAQNSTLFGGSLTYLGNNEIALKGAWYEDTDHNGTNDKTHPCVFRMNLDGGGDVSLICENSDTGLMGDMVYMPMAGAQQPEGWGFSHNGSFWLTTWANMSTPLVEVSAASLHMTPYGSIVSGNLNNGDLLALGFHEFHNPAYGFQKQYYVVTRFDRTGKYKGMWLLGSAIQDSGVDYSMGPIGELSNGDIVCGTGWQSILGGTASSYHYYIVRPPAGAGAAKIVVDPSSIAFPQIKTGSATSTTLTIANVGSSGLTINKYKLTGTNAGLFTVSAPTTPTLIAPGYGFVGPESSIKAVVTFKPKTPGPANAALEIESTDPTTPKKSVSMTGYGYPATLSDVNVTTLSQSVAFKQYAYVLVTSLQFTPDGSRLLACFSNPSHEWIIAGLKPLRDSQCRLTGVDPTTYTVVARLGSPPAYCDWRMNTGPDGTMWVTGSYNGDKVYQYRDNGTSFTQTLPGSDRLISIAFSPAGDYLVAKLFSHENALYSYPLTKNGQGFWTLGARKQIQCYFYPNVNRVCFCRRPDGRFDLFFYLNQHMTAPDGFWTGDSFVPNDQAEFMQSVYHNDESIDPLTNDLVYIDQGNLLGKPFCLRRLDGIHQYCGVTFERSRLCNILTGNLSAALTSAQRSAIDANGDGKIDVADLVRLVNNKR